MAHPLVDVLLSGSAPVPLVSISNSVIEEVFVSIPSPPDALFNKCNLYPGELVPIPTRLLSVVGKILGVESVHAFDPLGKNGCISEYTVDGVVGTKTDPLLRK